MKAPKVASHADVLRGSSRVPAPRTSAEPKDKFLSHCSQYQLEITCRLSEIQLALLKSKCSSQTHRYKLCRERYVTKDFCCGRESRR